MFPEAHTGSGLDLARFLPMVRGLTDRYGALARQTHAGRPIYLGKSDLDVESIRNGWVSKVATQEQQRFFGGLKDLVDVGDGVPRMDQDGLIRLLLSLDSDALNRIVSRPTVGAHLNTALTDVAWQGLLDDTEPASLILKHLQSVRGLLIGKSDIIRSILETHENNAEQLFGQDGSDSYIRQLEQLEPGLDQHIKIHILGSRLFAFIAWYDLGEWENVMEIERDFVTGLLDAEHITALDLEDALDLVPAA